MMAKNQRISIKKTSNKKQDVVESEVAQNNERSDADKLLKITDELLKEIDEIIEPLGVEFVKEFVQAGGQ